MINYRFQDYTTVTADIEADGLREAATKLHCLAMYDYNSGNSKLFANGSREEGFDKLQHPEVIAGHNIIDYDIPVIKDLIKGWETEALLVDTLVWSKLLFTNLLEKDKKAVDAQEFDKETFKVWDSNKGKEVTAIGRHSLEAWGLRLGFPKNAFGRFWDYQEYTDAAGEYCLDDVKTNDAVLRYFIKESKRQELPWEALQLEFDVQRIISKQMEHGWYFDKELAERLYTALVAERSSLEKEIQEVFPGWDEETKTPEYYFHKELKFEAPTKGELQDLIREWKKERKEAGTLKSLFEGIEAAPNRKNHIPFNPNSRHHMAKVFKEKYNWTSPECTPDGGPKMSGDILSKLEFPEAKILCDLEVINDRLEKLAEGRNGGYLAFLKEDGRLHGYVNTLGTKTYRATHSYPHVGQVPSNRVPYGKTFRKLFTVPEGKVLVGTDACGLELRILAAYMAEWDNGEYVKEAIDGDIHTKNMEAFGIDCRDTAKTAFYALIYGCGIRKMAQILGVSMVEAKEILNRFYEKLPALKNITDRCKENAAKNGYNITLDGRRVYTKPDADYAALNDLVQSAGAIICKRWMVNLDKLLVSEGIREHCQQVGFIHDELQFEATEGTEDKVLELSKQAMRMTEKFYNFKCPLDADGAWGKNWSETH
jgi:DNA polymerase I-like protein with 3'-5' exonuclease and polymerase domains